jgi:hypothetical protein
MDRAPGEREREQVMDSRSDQDKKRRRHDLWLAILLLLLGLICLWITATLAVRPDRTWQVSADMLSKLNPDVGEVQPVELVPVGEKALTPLPVGILTPVGTPSPAPVAFVGKLPTSTPTRQATPVPPATSTDTPAPVSPPTSTFTPRPPNTSTPLPTSTPTLTGLPALTFTPLPIPTFTPVLPTSVPPTSVPPTSVPPTDTPTFTPLPPPTDTPTFTPTPTNTPAPPTPIPPPTVLSITPNQGLNTNPVDVVITGADFMATPTVYLGPNQLINVTWVNANTINARVPVGLTPGVYALTVINPDLQSDTLPAAYTVLAPVDPNTTLETGYLMTFGSGASGDDGDDDYVQVIFFEVPTSYGGGNPVYFRIYDADTGGGVGETLDELRGIDWNTSMTYAVYGGAGAYTGAQAAHPNSGQITAGTWLSGTVVAANPAYDGNWGLVLGPFQANEGEDMGGSWVFKVVVQGGSNDDGNAYNIAMSTDAGNNTAPAGSRVFAYSWTFVYASTNPRPPVYPYVPAGTSTFTQFNWDFDYAFGSMTLHTPVQDILVPPSGISGNGAAESPRSSSHAVGTWEDDTTWTVTIEFAPSIPRNCVTFWATGDGGVNLAIFAHATTGPPP